MPPRGRRRRQRRQPLYTGPVPRFSFDKLGVELEGGWRCDLSPAGEATLLPNQTGVPANCRWNGRCPDADYGHYFCYNAPSNHYSIDELLELQNGTVDADEDVCEHCTRERIVARRRGMRGLNQRPPSTATSASRPVCRCPREYAHDGSVEIEVGRAGDPESIRHVGEVRLGPVATLGDLHHLLVQHYPNETNRSCGMHVHMSFRSTIDYERLMKKDLTEFVCDGLIKWGQQMERRRGWTLPSQFYERLRGENTRYCARTYQGSLQVGADGRGSRYTVFNYCYTQHGTLECRVLPMMPDAAIAFAAINKLCSLVLTYLIRHTRNIRPIQVEDTLTLEGCEQAAQRQMQQEAEATVDSLTERMMGLPPLHVPPDDLGDVGLRIYDMAEDIRQSELEDQLLLGSVAQRLDPELTLQRIAAAMDPGRTTWVEFRDAILQAETTMAGFSNQLSR